MAHKRLGSDFTDETSRRKRKKEYDYLEDLGIWEAPMWEAKLKGNTRNAKPISENGKTESLEPSPPANLAANGLSKKDWEVLEASQEKIPRFLFRAFGRKSGGDARLNTVKGIVPLGFLRGRKPTNMYEISDLKNMIKGHFYGDRQIKTQFSSWAACISIAMKCGSHSEYIAIIDRTLLAPHVKIYHVPDLMDTFYPEETRPYETRHEYLAYGPINGPAFHCVAYQDIVNADYHSVAGCSYMRPSFRLAIFEDVDWRVATAKKLASLFRPVHDKRPDIIIALTAAFSCLSYCGPNIKSRRVLDKELLGKLLIHLWDEIKAIKLPPADPNKLFLVNSSMYTLGFPQLQQLVFQVGAIEDKIRNKGAVILGRGS